MKSYKEHYRRFIQANTERVHFTAHSHHFWPDVTRDAMLRYWDDAALRVDGKWAYFFDDFLPQLKAKLCAWTGLDYAEGLVFAPNTHELVGRVLSAFPQELRVLTSAGEFHSFRRQIRRLNELERVHVDEVPLQPFDSFGRRFCQHLEANHYELAFLSRVFFRNAWVVKEIDRIIEFCRQRHVHLLVDDYHGFGALPLSEGMQSGDYFYLAGGYKYAQAGEGGAFMRVPQGCSLRPVNTGWFADLEQIDGVMSGEISYGDDGMRFAGATMDLSPLYRLDAVLDWWAREAIEVRTIHMHVRELQREFLARIDSRAHSLLNAKSLLLEDWEEHGHFLAFDCGVEAAAFDLCRRLSEEGIVVDRRGAVVRFGFGLYHDLSDLDRFSQVFSALS